MESLVWKSCMFIALIALLGGSLFTAFLIMWIAFAYITRNDK